MAKSKTYTQEQLESAKKNLAALPDLSKDKITTSELLAALKDQIVTLSVSKGYSIADIKSALTNASIDVSAKAISEILSSNKKTRAPRKPATKPAS